MGMNASHSTLRFRISGVAALAALVVASAGAQSQPAATQLSLELRQAAIRERVQQLENRLLMLGRVLAESEPDRAERVRAALDQSGQRQVKRRLDRLVQLLRAGQLSEAEREQEALLADLESVLAVLTDTSSDLDRRRAERERLDGFRRAIRALQEGQLEQLYRTHAAAAAEQLAQRLREQAERAARLVEQQRELRDQPPADADRHRAAQDELEQQARALARALADQQQATSDESAAGALREATDQTERAADRMHAAATAPEAAREAVAPAQREAEEALRRVAARLRTEAERLDGRAALEDIERAQRTLERQAADVAEKMKAPADTAPKTPGERQVHGARQHMQGAADRLGEQAEEEAQVEQQAALEQLQRAQEELDDALRQVRREELEETLAALETRFKSMLTRERQVRQEVATLYTKGSDRWTRTDQLKLTELAQTQRGVADDCAAVVRILVGEGTTVILPEMVEQLGRDVADVASRLEQSDLAPPTQTALDLVIEVLAEIVSAIEVRRQEERDAAAQAPDAGANDAGRPLLPGSVELKLLRSAQLRINEQTAAADAADAQPLEERRPMLQRLAQRQRQIAEMSRRMNERP